MKKLFFCFLLQALIVTASFSQNDFSTQYANAKGLFKDGKYNLAMETFKPLISYDQKNKYAEYASFYYALSAYRQGYSAVAKDMFNQIKKLYPNWEKINEVNFWLGKIHLENKDYFQGIKLLSSINDKSFDQSIQTAENYYVSSIKDLETLRMMNEEYPTDAVIAKNFAAELSKSPESADRQVLEELIDKFKFKKTDFIPETPKSVMKEKYAVSLLLPFMVGNLEPTPGKKRNQVILDFYEGLKLAVDTLDKQNVKISLRAYDTERSVEKIKKIIETQELKYTDLIVGPFYPEENKVVQEFSQANAINIIHPFSNNSEIIDANPFGFLFQPSSETLGRKSAEYLAAHDREKNTMVFYGTGKKDSVLAANFVAAAKEKGIQILLTEKVNSREAKKVTDILATPIEFDEFKYPKEFSLKKDSISSVFVASDDPLIYTKVIGAVEARNDSTMVIGTENWLDDNAIDLDKYETLGIVMAAPNFVATTRNPAYKAFEQKFMKVHGRPASAVALRGYEFMLFIGNQLKKNGVYFQQALQSGDVLPGYLGQGFDYRYSRDNELVPFIAFQKGQLTLIEKR
jgi:ABC-type branched-subunit amino acid transport system substrate-binding protein